MSDGFDFSELEDFDEELLELATSFEDGKHAKKFLNKEGNKLKRGTVKLAQSRVKKDTGNLFKGIKRGKPYKYAPENTMAVRVYAGDPAYHAHLLNYGHRIVDKNGKEHKDKDHGGFAKGHHFFEDAADEFEDKFFKNTKEFVKEMLNEKGLY